MVMAARGRPSSEIPPRLALCIGLLVLAALPAGVEAHAVLVRSAPEARASVRVPPRRAQLWFSERLEPAYATMSVWNDRTKVDSGDAEVSREDARQLSVALPPLDRGVYVVKYHVLSVDGHVAEGGYSFTVKGEAGRK